MLQNEPLIAEIGIDTAETGPREGLQNRTISLALLLIYWLPVDFRSFHRDSVRFRMISHTSSLNSKNADSLIDDEIQSSWSVPRSKHGLMPKASASSPRPKARMSTIGIYDPGVTHGAANFREKFQKNKKYSVLNSRIFGKLP